MTLAKAIILGIVQGITEFLPVSSSGHLAILKYIFGIKDVGIEFDIFLHLGTLIAVVLVYYKDIWRLIKTAVKLIGCVVSNLVLAIRRLFDEEAKFTEYKKVTDTPYKRFVWMILISSIPVALVGFFLEDYIELVSTGLLIPGICLLITGVLLLLGDAFPDGNLNMKTTKFRHSVIIGIAQAFAALPGISRSGATISTGMMCGLNKEFAVKYSFILSVPAILGAVLKSCMDMLQGEFVIGSNLKYYLIGAVIAAVIGYIAIRTLLVIVRHKGFKYFSIYCFVIGVLAIAGFIAL